MSGREIAIEAKPRIWLVRGSQLDAFALARPAWGGYRLVTAECRLAVEVENEDCALEFEVRQRLRSHPDLVAGRLSQ